MISRDIVNRALSILEKDRLRNSNIINFIENNRINDIAIVNNSVLVRGVTDREWLYISSTDKKELKILCSNNSNDKNFGVIENWMIPIVIKENKIRWRLTAIKLYLPDNILMDKPKYNAVPISLDDVDFIFENSTYKDYLTKDYISDRIKKGISAGIYKSGKLIAWAITHDDGAMGFLNVLEEYRRRGYAQAVSYSMIDQLRAKKKIPFAHIEENNIKSMNLTLKMGFLKDRVVNWFGI